MYYEVLQVTGSDGLGKLVVGTGFSSVVVAGQFGWNGGGPTAPAGTTLVLPGQTLTSISNGDAFLAAFVR